MREIKSKPKSRKKKEIKCPKCANGTLELLKPHEKTKIKSGFLSDDVLGCDECQYWIEADLL